METLGGLALKMKNEEKEGPFGFNKKGTDEEDVKVGLTD